MSLNRKEVKEQLSKLYEDFYRACMNDPILTLSRQHRDTLIEALDDKIRIYKLVLADIDRVAEHGDVACWHSSVSNRDGAGSHCDICDYSFPEVSPKV